MTTNLIQSQESETEAIWTPPLPPTDLIFDDGEPLESNRHRIAMNSLIDALYQAYQGRNDFFAAGNMFLYYSSKQVRNQDFRGPDFFVVLNVDGKKPRQGWVVWDEEGRYPNIIVELLSPTTAKIDKEEKKQIYEQTFHTQDYLIYDPFDENSLQGWSLGTNGKYQELVADRRGWLWCQTLELWLGKWTGTILQEEATWLRFYDREGNLVLLGSEKAEQEKLRADLAEANLQQEQLRADLAEANLQQEQQEKEQVLAELAQQSAALAAERQQTKLLRDRAKLLGIELET
jgi:Uma2 family endonuclease